MTCPSRDRRGALEAEEQLLGSWLNFLDHHNFVKEGSVNKKSASEGKGS